MICITEKVEYQQDPENSQQTVVKRNAWIESRFHIRALRRPIEVFIYNKFSQSCIKTVNGFQWVLSKMWTRDSGNVNSGPVKLNDLAIEAARRASKTIPSLSNVGLSN